MEYFVFFTRTLYRKLYWDNNLYYLTEKKPKKYVLIALCLQSWTP